ncbi:hypothetical protein IAR50_000550 [Cryptococcus sp. DSM 104548]
MPRSPSPPRLPHRPRLYRDDSPPPFRDPRDDYRFSREPRYRNNHYDRNDRPDWRERERDDDRNRDYQGPRYTGSRTSWYSRDRERDDRMTARSPMMSPLPRRPIPPPMDRERERERGRDDRAASMAGEGSVKARSEGTPEEGQITSPVHPPPAPPVLLPLPSMAGLPARPHSPPLRSPAIRRRTRSPPPFRRVERDSWRDRDRERDRERFFRRRSPSPYSPPVHRRRSPSVSSASTPSRSSRFSPIKRAISPVSDRRRSRSPSEKRPHFEPPRSPSPPPRSEINTSSPPPANLAPKAAAPAAAPAPARPVPIAVPLSGFNQFAKRPPPTGPRSMGAAAAPGFAPPTGPRALAHLYGGRPAPTGPRAYAPLSTASLASAGRATAMVSTPVSATSREETEPPRASRAPSETPSAHSTGAKEAPPSGPRLSWSERKTLPAQTPAPAPGLAPVPSPAAARAATSPYAQHPHVNTAQTPYNQPAASSSPAPVSTTPYPTSAILEQEDAKPHVEEPVLSKEEAAEIRAKEEEAMIMAELPAVAVPFGGAQWEIDLANYHHHCTALLQNTLRAHAVQRQAAIVLADAEAERAAVMERRRICEGQLMTGMVGVGGMLGAV